MMKKTIILIIVKKLAKDVIIQIIVQNAMIQVFI